MFPTKKLTGTVTGMVPKEGIILIHGHAAPSFFMEPLRRRLRNRVYHAEIWSYPSTSGSIGEYANKLSTKIDELEADSTVRRLHLVGHSMGAIIVRTALTKRRWGKLGRAVLLAPPNRGARIADFALQFFRGPLAAKELSSRPDSFVNGLPSETPVEFGIIAAAYDHAVSVASTHLRGELDHIVLQSFHTILLFHRQLPSLISCFLENGRFRKE